MRNKTRKLNIKFILKKNFFLTISACTKSTDLDLKVIKRIKISRETVPLNSIYMFRKRHSYLTNISYAKRYSYVTNIHNRHHTVTTMILSNNDEIE